MCKPFKFFQLHRGPMENLHQGGARAGKQRFFFFRIEYVYEGTTPPLITVFQRAATLTGLKLRTYPRSRKTTKCTVRLCVSYSCINCSVSVFCTTLSTYGTCHLGPLPGNHLRAERDAGDEPTGQHNRIGGHHGRGKLRRCLRLLWGV